MKNGSVMIVVAVILAAVIGAVSVLGYQKFLAKSQSINTEPTMEPKNSSFSVATDEKTLPVIAWKPPLQSSQYLVIRNEIQKKVLSPFIDYHNEVREGETRFVAIIISESKNSDYPYSLEAIQHSGNFEGELLSGTKTSVNWWIPTCQRCEFSQNYKEKYPEVVKNFE